MSFSALEGSFEARIVVGCSFGGRRVNQLAERAVLLRCRFSSTLATYKKAF